MRCIIIWAGICSLGAGCTGSVKDDAQKAMDADSVYEAVMKEELKNLKDGTGYYVFVDGKDPNPQLLQRFQQHWPGLQPGSKVPAGRANSVSLKSLQWIDQNTAELRGGFSNGMDGRGSRYRVIVKDGAWVVEKAVVEVQS